nr:hypothetical protein [Phaseolus vulgaris]
MVFTLNLIPVTFMSNLRVSLAQMFSLLVIWVNLWRKFGVRRLCEMERKWEIIIQTCNSSGRRLIMFGQMIFNAFMTVHKLTSLKQIRHCMTSLSLKPDRLILIYLGSNSDHQEIPSMPCTSDIFEISEEEAEDRLQDAIQEKFSVFGDKEHQAIDILLAEIDIYELFAFKHCKGRKVKLALCEAVQSCRNCNQQICANNNRYYVIFYNLCQLITNILLIISFGFPPEIDVCNNLNGTCIVNKYGVGFACEKLSSKTRVCSQVISEAICRYGVIFSFNRSFRD